MRLFLDMDGVLMNFEGHVRKHGFWWEGPTYHHLPESEWTEAQATNDRKYKDLMATPDFWTTMEPMADAHMLWNYCRPLGAQVLTATPAKAAYRDRCANDKLRSIHQHFDPTFPSHDFHAVLRSEKRKFAGSHENGDRAILVDDMEPNCREWTEAGGIAILHRDAVSTIRILREILHD